jgi:hypothetical protein
MHPMDESAESGARVPDPNIYDQKVNNNLGLYSV